MLDIDFWEKKGSIRHKVEIVAENEYKRCGRGAIDELSYAYEVL